MKKIILTVIVLFCFIGTETLLAQVLMREVSLKKQIDNSSLVVEGKVIAKKSFWNTDNGLIYTSNTIEVYKVFKGSAVTSVDVITLGGTVGLKALIANPSLKLYNGDIGVFTLQNSNVSAYAKNSKSTEKEFRPYGSSQGFYRYNLYNDLAVNSFRKKKGIESFFYKEIMSHTKKGFIVMSDFDVQSKNKSNKAKGLLPPSSLTLNKSVATAGTKEVLTITGSGFGGTQGKVWFSNADDGGETFISALDSQVTWVSDGEIQVEIPSGAGSGPIFVEDSGLLQSPLSSSLTISYSEINVPYNPGSGVEDFQVQHVNDNGSGGYTWEMQTHFFNDTEHPGAKVAFERAFNNWVCETGVNWTISGTATTTDVIGIVDLTAPFDGELDPEGVNVIRFDNGSELEDITMNDDILGVCFSWYSICLSTPVKVYVIELDIVFDSDINDPITPATESWYFGSDPLGIAFTQWDFESVALHELGHGHQLGHVIDNSTPVDNGNDVMHYALQNFEYQRVISANNSTAANNIQTRSTGTVVLCATQMTNASCPLSVEEDELNDAISIFPNPAKEQFYIKNGSLINLEKVAIYDISGRLISEYNISNTSRTKTINLVGVSKGIYFVNIHSDEAMITRKMVLD